MPVPSDVRSSPTGGSTSPGDALRVFDCGGHDWRGTHTSATVRSGDPLLLGWRGIPACGAALTGRPVCIGAASTSATARRRWCLDRTLAWGLTQPIVASGSEPELAPWSTAVAACPVARLARVAGGNDAMAVRTLCSPAYWTLRSLGPFAGDTLVPASLFDCAGVACLLIAQSDRPGLARAWLRRQLPLQCGGDLTGCRPGGWTRRWWYQARSQIRRLGAQWRLLAPSHIFRAPLVAAVHWWRELFARPGAGPYETSNGLPATPLSRRDSSTVLA
jgi:hypothetical protein